MRGHKFIPAALIAAILLLIGACAKGPAAPVRQLRHLALDDLTGVITQDGVYFDKTNSSDGGGSLAITSTGPRVVTIFELGNLDIEDARLIYQARLRTADLRGKVYLELRCHFAGAGEFFSRDLESPVTGSVDWCTEETIFFLQKGQNPDNIKLNLVFEGAGTVWIDDIKLLAGPLQL